MKNRSAVILMFMLFPFTAGADNIPNARIRLTDNSQVETPLADCLKAAYARQGAGKFGEILSFGDLDYLYTSDGDVILNMAQVPALTDKKDEDKKNITVHLVFEAPLRDAWRVYYYGDDQDAMEASAMLPFANVVDKASAPLFKLDLGSCRDLFVHLE